ncbi:ribonuclease J [Bdellovibrionota bacterium]
MSLRVIPLGGLGEFGLNAMVVEVDDQQFLIDCGVMFPEPSIGVDYIIPDFQYLLKEPGKLSGIILTHGHEDHIGALPFLIRQCPAPIYAAPFTAALIVKKFHDIGMEIPEIIEISPPERIAVKNIDVEFIPVCHSIPDACSVAFHTSQGILLHSGDFKSDSTPFLGKTLSLDRFKTLGKEGVRLLLSESTNVISPGDTEPEKSITKPLEEIFANSEGRIIAGIFSSHIQRVQNLLDLAKKFNRKVALEGRSLQENVSLSTKMDYLSIPAGMLIRLEDIGSYKDDEILIIATGTQGEFRSALNRMTIGEHPLLSIHEGDTLIHSARIIPGNEKAVGHMFDAFYRKGARVIDNSDHLVHASGHAKQGDLSKLLKLTNPDYFVPIHGEYRHLAKHAELAKECGLKKEQVILMEDGQSLSINKSGASLKDFISTERAYIEGMSFGDMKSATIRTRRQLARLGLVIVIILRDPEDGSIITGPHVIAKGVTDSEELLEEIKTVSKRAILNPIPEFEDPHEEVRVLVRRLLEKHLAKRPLVVPLILEV